jgi:hypothetical protein
MPAAIVTEGVDDEVVEKLSDSALSLSDFFFTNPAKEARASFLFFISLLLFLSRTLHSFFVCILSKICRLDLSSSLRQA